METTKQVDYEVIQQIEILREFAAGVLAATFRYVSDNNIDENDDKNIVIVIQNEVADIWRDVYDIQTMDEARITSGKLQIINEIFKKLDA